MLKLHGHFISFFLAPSLIVVLNVLEMWHLDDWLTQKVNLNVRGRSEVFLWKVNKKVLWELVLNDMFHTALNISQKIAQVNEEFLVCWSHPMFYSSWFTSSLSLLLKLPHSFIFFLDKFTYLHQCFYFHTWFFLLKYFMVFYFQKLDYLKGSKQII